MFTKFSTVYVKTDDGLELPVIDLTNPAFAFDPTEAQLARLTEDFAKQAPMRQNITEHVRRALAASIVGRGLMAAKGTFLSGLNTYILKLGGDNLKDPFTTIDRSIVDSLPGLAVRLRMQDMAQLLSESLAPQLRQQPSSPLLLINIAGGPAADSWNTLILLRDAPGHLLANRRILIAVLDDDEGGPRFGARAVEALRGPGGHLKGVNIEVRHLPYNWSHPEKLRDILTSVGVSESVCAASSEGALFEYGSDTAIVDNLGALKELVPAGTVMAGSVTRKDHPGGGSGAAIGVAVVPRSIEEFGSLVTSAGWSLDSVRTRPFSFNVRLMR